MKYLLFFVALLCLPSPAIADSWTRENHRLEIAFQALNLADFATTEYCLRRGTCHEANPLIGGHPSTEKLLAIKAGTGIAHYFISRELARRDPKAARIFQYASIALQGGVVAANFRFVF